MPDTWIRALKLYLYPVNFNNFSQKQEFPGFFNKNISGDKRSTEEFEKDYQKNAPQNLAAFFEVIYWCYYFLEQNRDSNTITRIQKINSKNVKSQQLWDSIKSFIQRPDENNLRKIQQLLGLSPVLFTPLALVALADPDNFPVVNKDVANWVNANLDNQNKNRVAKLTKFLNPNSLQNTDFQNYLNWRAWARETAEILTNITNEKWRTRDVEMAVYAAPRNRINLEAISMHQIPTVSTKISPQKMEGPTQIQNFTIERSIYDPVTQKFIISKERPLVNVQDWIQRKDPCSYWFILCVHNNTDSLIDEWGVELDSSSSLKILECHIEGLEHTPALIESHPVPWQSKWSVGVPRHFGITLPREGSRRLYFKLSSTTCGVSHSIHGHLVAPGGILIPIREKLFDHSCDVATLPMALSLYPAAAEQYIENLLGELSEKERLIETQKTELLSKENELITGQSTSTQLDLELTKKIEHIERNKKELDELTCQIHKERELIETQKRVLENKTQELEERIKLFNKVPESCSRFVKAGDVKQYEMTFIGRTEKKIGKTGVPIEIHGITFIVEGISENKGIIPINYIHQIKRQLTEIEIKNLPENRYLTIKLVEKKFLGRKRRYTFCSLFRSRPRNYAEFGFDTEPLTVNDINPILDKARDEAKRIGEPFFLCIASPTGFVPELHGFIDSEDFHKNFLSRYLSVCFLDLETAKLIFNPTDEIARSFLPYCEMVFESEKMKKIRMPLFRNLDEQFQQKSYAEYSLALKGCQYDGPVDEGLVKAAFYQYGDEKGKKVKYIEGVGLVIMS